MSESMRPLNAAWPVTATQIGLIAFGFIELAFLGRVSTVAANSAALGYVWMSTTLVVGYGVSLASDIPIGNACANEDAGVMLLALQKAMLSCFWIALPIAGLWLGTGPILVFFGIEKSLAMHAHRYVLYQLPGLLPLLWFLTLRQFWQARGHAKQIAMVLAFANLLHVTLSWIFVFSAIKSSALIWVGPAISSSIARIAMFTAIVLMGIRMGAPSIRRLFGQALWPLASQPWRYAYDIRQGVIIGLQMGIEQWAFQGATLIAARLGPTSLAAHAIVLNITSFTYTLPLGLSRIIATELCTSASKPIQDRIRMSKKALQTSAVMMTGIAVSMWALARYLPHMYSSDSKVVGEAARVLPLVGLSQIPDGMQVTAAGILRAWGKANRTLAVNIIGYGLVALPLAHAGVRFGLLGIWAALSIGLIAISLLLMWSLRKTWNRSP